LRVDFDTSMTNEDVPKSRAMLPECPRIELLPELVEQPCRALDVGEEKRQGPGREIVSRHALESI
jgi:hypothetical protein